MSGGPPRDAGKVLRDLAMARAIGGERLADIGTMQAEPDTANAPAARTASAVRKHRRAAEPAAARLRPEPDLDRGGPACRGIDRLGADARPHRHPGPHLGSEPPTTPAVLHRRTARPPEAAEPGCVWPLPTPCRTRSTRSESETPRGVETDAPDDTRPTDLPTDERTAKNRVRHARHEQPSPSRKDGGIGDPQPSVTAPGSPSARRHCIPLGRSVHRSGWPSSAQVEDDASLHLALVDLLEALVDVVERCGSRG